MISKALIEKILQEYGLPPMGIHGVSHWARVMENGLRIAEATGANVRVVQLFAVFHDSRRINEGIDAGHGGRGAEFAARMRGQLFDLSPEEFDLLFTACQHHTDTVIHPDVTIRTCWDADRLDLGRVGRMPKTEYLCTDSAKEADMIAWANGRSLHFHVPPLIYDQWGLDLSQIRNDRAGHS